MKPSSSTSEPASGGLFDGVLARGAVRDEVSDRAWLQAMLDVEAALARAQAVAGTMDPRRCGGDRARVSRRATSTSRAIGRDAADSGNPVVPLVRALDGRGRGPAAARPRAPRRDQPGHPGHRGDADRAARARSAARRPARRRRRGRASSPHGHRDTLMAGRTLLQHALPITFGLKAAGWIDGARRGGRASGRRAARRGSPCSSAAPRERSPRSATTGRPCCARSAEELGLAEPAIAVAHRPHARRRAGRGARRRRGRHRQGGRATSCCWRRPRSARCARACRAAAARRRCRTSATPWRPCAARAVRRPARPALVATLLASMVAGARARGGRVARRVAAARRAPGDAWARRRRGSATASSISRSTSSGCARTST